MTYMKQVRARRDFFKYANPDVVVHEPKHIGDFVDEIPERVWKETFLRDTPELWDNKRVLDLGCGGPETRILLTELYPTVDYTGVDLFDISDPKSIRADATNTIPFMGLKFGKDFDTVSCFGFNSKRFPGLPFGGYGHLRKYLKDGGHFVYSYNQAKFTINKPSICLRIAESVKIVEDRQYSYTFRHEESDHALPITLHYLICVHKT